VSRLLVTGASGLLGANLVLQATPEHEVIAVSHRQRLAAPGVTSRQVDLTVREEARALIAEFAPDWIVHCAAATDIDRCEDEPDVAFRLNRDMAADVAASVFGPRLQAAVVTLTARNRVSRRDMSELARELFGIRLSVGTRMSDFLCIRAFGLRSGF